MSQIQSIHAAETNVTGERVVMLLFRHGLTQQKLGLETGINGGVISRKLRGQGRWYADELAAIARRLDTSVAYLIGETDNDECPRQDSNLRPTD